MVALIDYDVTVPGNEIGDGVLAHDALEHRNVYRTGDGTLAATEPAERLRIDIEEQRELGDPLVEKRLTVHEEQGTSPA